MSCDLPSRFFASFIVSFGRLRHHNYAEVFDRLNDKETVLFLALYAFRPIIYFDLFDSNAYLYACDRHNLLIII